MRDVFGPSNGEWAQWGWALASTLWQTTFGVFAHHGLQRRQLNKPRPSARVVCDKTKHDLSHWVFLVVAKRARQTLVYSAETVT